MNNNFYKENRKALAENLTNGSLVIIFAGESLKKTADEVFPFVANRNFLYLTGIKEPSVIFTMTKVKDEIKEEVFIKKADPFWEKWLGKTISREEAIEISGIENIRFIDEFEGYVNSCIVSGEAENIYLDLERDNFNHSLTHNEEFAKKLIEKYPYIRIKNVYNMISDLREVKKEYEIEEMRTAIDITHEGIKSLMTNAKAGMIEYQLEAYFDFVLKTRGCKDVAFKTIAAAGKNATVLHYSVNNNEIKDGDLILFDLGAQWNYYSADISRTFPVNGKFTERQKQIYNIVLKANIETIKAIKPGVLFGELNKVTKRVLAEGLKEIGLIKEDEELSKYYYHGVSHHLGLDTHDVGTRQGELKEGMVLTVEPGLYIEEECIGIRIEDDILVTKEGNENLSKDIIKTVEEIENFMANR